MVYKCKICGGDTIIDNKTGIMICEYCGTKQALPLFTDESTRLLYERGNNYLSHNEYSQAESIFNQLLTISPNEPELYWDLVLCKYGVTYVKDPKTDKYIPTCNRTHYTPIFKDENYLKAIELSSGEKNELYKSDAKIIDDIQKGILSISKKEESFDVFICYKETDENGDRTPDSVIANDLYDQLTNRGYKVFFSRITLESKLGSAYEPYIFAALNSAKVMVVIGTKTEYFNAVWVKNEWSRYLDLIKNGENKTLIPAFKNIDANSLPEEFAYLQAQDMSKLGFMQDLVRGIEKLIGDDRVSTQTNTRDASSSSRPKNRKKTLAVLVPIACVLIALSVLLTTLIIPKFRQQNVENKELDKNYQNAISLIKSQQYDKAYDALVNLGDYKDTKQLLSNFSIVYENVTSYLSQLYSTSDYTYDSNGNCTKIINTTTYDDVEGGGIDTTEYIYDEKGNCIKEIFSSGSHQYNTEYIYDENGNRIKELEYDYAGELSSIIEYLYDEYGNCTKNLSYDMNGALISTTLYTYAQSLCTGETTMINDQISEMYQYNYDSNGNRIKTEMLNSEFGELSTIESQYNSNGDEIRSEYYLSDGTLASCYEYAYKYDNNGNYIEKKCYQITEGSDQYTYDSNGHCVKHVNSAFYNGTQTSTEYTYSESGNCTKEVLYDSDGSVTYTLKYTYDEKGNCVEETGSPTGSKKFTYNENGNLIKTTYDDNRYIEYSYNENGNLIKEVNYTSTGTPVNTIEYTYDAEDRVTKKANTDSYSGYGVELYEYEYDSIGNCIKETYTNPFDGSSTITKYTYENPKYFYHPSEK